MHLSETVDTDLPENTHPKQETAFHISSPYSHSWNKKIIIITKLVWNHTDNFQVMRWSRDSSVCRKKPRHTAPYKSYICMLEMGTPFMSLNVPPRDRASKELQFSSFSEKTSSRASMECENTSTLTPTVFNYKSLSEGNFST